MDIYEKALKAHETWKGKLSIAPKCKVRSREELSLAYTPGVARPCLEIRDDPEKSYLLTGRHNVVAVITDGSAVLGLGDIGPEAGMPVMEGKCLLFKEFADVDAVPLCVRTKDPDEFVRTVSLLLGGFGGVNLEDIAAPRCFEIERKLKAISDIPIFHDDQHGTAIVASAAMMNAIRIVGKEISSLRVVINGAGAAGSAIGRMFLHLGVRDLVFVDRCGALVDPDEQQNAEHALLAAISNPEKRRGDLAQVIRGADLFVGVSRPGLLSPDMVRSMAKDPVVFAMANPEPEIYPEQAYKAGAAVVGTGRSDDPNQINNLLAFPGVFRGALDCRASEINEEMKEAAALALAGLVSDRERENGRILPDVFDRRAAPAVALAVREAALRTGVARLRPER